MPYLFIVRYIRITYYYYYQSLSIYIKYSNFDLIYLNILLLYLIKCLVHIVIYLFVIGLMITLLNAIKFFKGLLLYIENKLTWSNNRDKTKLYST